MANHDRDFDAFIQKLQPAPENAPPVDWNKQREDWLRYLNALYEDIENYLDKYTKSGGIKIEYSETRLTEDFIGSYTVRQMILNIGRQKVLLKPIGTLLIGSKGRVDIVGPSGQARFVLVNRNSARPSVRVVITTGTKPPAPQMPQDEEIEWAWKIATNAPTISYLDLTKESLFQTLMDVSNA